MNKGSLIHTRYGDGKKDILTLGSFSNGTGYYGQLRVWNWNGSVMFLEKSDDWHEAVPVEPGAAESLKAADLDNDGDGLGWILVPKSLNVSEEHQWRQKSAVQAGFLLEYGA